MFWLSEFVAAFRQGSARRSAVRTLASLSSAELRDLGLPPDRIDEVVGDMLARRQGRRLHDAASAYPAAPIRAPQRPVSSLQGC